MLMPGKLATPATAATVVVPSSTPLPGGLSPIASVTVPVNVVAVLPSASRAVTWTAGVIAAPAAVLPGWTVNASWVAAPAVIVNGALVAWVRPVAVATRVYPAPASSMLRPGKVATPATAATLVVPSSTPPGGGFAPMATVTGPVKPVAVLPNTSRAVTATAGVIGAPA